MSVRVAEEPPVTPSGTQRVLSTYKLLREPLLGEVGVVLTLAEAYADRIKTGFLLDDAQYFIDRA